MALRGLLMIAAAAAAYSVVMKKQRERTGLGAAEGPSARMSTAPDAQGMAPPLSGGTGMAGAAGVDDLQQPVGGSRFGTGAGADSPNTGEQLRATQAGGVYAGIGQNLPGGGGDARLFPEAERREGDSRGGDEVTPGLPDFARGA